MAIFDRNDKFQSYDFERNILTPYLKEYSNVTMFDRFTGGADSVIFAKVSNAGQGDDIIYNQRQNFNPTVKIGNERLVEAEDELTYGVERLRVGFYRFATRVTNRELQELQINHKFSPDIKSQLLWQAEKLNSERIMRQFGLAFSNNDRGLPNQQYTYAELIAKIKACGIDVNANGEAISRSRVMFGLDVGTNAATVDAGLTTLVGSDAATNTLTSAHLFKLAALAGQGSRTAVANKEAPIRPYTLGASREGYPDKKYLFLTSNDAYYKLSQDPDWQAQERRGLIQNECQPAILFGSNYKGTIHGVMVVTFPEFSNYVFEQGGNTVAYSAFLGASAMGLGMGQIPNFAQESYDYGLYYGLAHVEISDAKVLKFPSKTNLAQKGVNPLRVENGMIHSFVRLD